MRQHAVQPSPDQPRNNRQGMSIEALTAGEDGYDHITKAYWRHNRERGGGAKTGLGPG